MKLMKLSLPRITGYTDDELRQLLSNEKIIVSEENRHHVQVQKIEKWDIDADFVHIYQDIDDTDMVKSMSRSELYATGIPSNYNSVLIGHSPYTGVPVFGLQKKNNVKTLTDTTPYLFSQSEDE